MILPQLRNFSQYIPSAAEIAALKAEYWDTVRDWSKAKLLGAMGYVNLVTFKLAMDYGALVPVEDAAPKGKANYTIDKRQLGELLHRSATGRLTYQVATTGVRKYLLEHWESAASSAPTLRKIRAVLSLELGLFTVEDIAPSGRKCDCPAPEWRQIDFVRLLLLHETLEEVLTDGNTSGIEMQRKTDGLPAEMPPYRGYWTVMLFNAVFEGVQEFRREANSHTAYLFGFCYPLGETEEDQEICDDVWDMVSARVNKQMEEMLEQEFCLPY